MGNKPRGTVGILSLGCPRNLVDSEGIIGRLNLKGYKIVDLLKADIAIINTCAFVEDAKKESIDAILDLIQLKKEGKLRKIIVYGCLSQRYKDDLVKELPEIDAFIGKVALEKNPVRLAITPKHFAYLKICEGCVNNCSFCVIPCIKGKFTSLDKGSLLKKVEEFNRDHLSELNIVGQDITGYGLDLYGKIKLPELIKDISRKAKQIHWIRLLYLYPSRISDELIEIIRDNPKICKYIDIPLQHVNSRILKLMRRHPNKAGIIKLIEKIRKKIPEVALRTAFIVGFPSETEKEFSELLDFIREFKFERLGAFIYSREEGTGAYGFKGQVQQKIKEARLDRLMLLQQEISAGINKNFLGRDIEVLIDEVGQGNYIGRSQYDAPEVDGTVYLKSSRKLIPGDFVTARVVDTLEYDLVAEVYQ